MYIIAVIKSETHHGGELMLKRKEDFIMETKKNFFEEIGHPSYVSASNSDMYYILSHFWEKGYFDDHEPKERRVRIRSNESLVALAIWTNYKATQVVPIYNGTFVINPLYIDNVTHNIHLSDCSCGGTVIGGNVERFNKEMSPNNQDRPYGFGEHLMVFTKEGWERIKDSIFICNLFKY